MRPVLDYKSLEPGHEATEALRAIAAKVAPQYQARVRLTGPVPMADEEFATIKENAALNGTITFAIVLFILWLALRSPKLMLAVFVNLLIGLPITAAVGLALVGQFNLISVYFAVLFVGIGVDFSIQYSVRYRAERHEIPDLTKAIQAAGHYVAAPLTLAGFATSLGFFSFLPTHYKGVSELGVIAGCGMLIAYATSVTVLPALISLLNPKGEPEPLGYTALAPLDNFLNRHRLPVLFGVIGVVVIFLPSLYWLRFDFNPINLRNPKTESIATYLDLKRDPATNLNALEVLAPDLDAANAIAAKVSKLPEVSRATTLSFFIPADQDARLPMIKDAAKSLDGAFDPASALPAPTDKENVDALVEGASRLQDAAKENPGAGADAAKALAEAMSSLAKADPKYREQADEVFITPLKRDLTALKASLAGEKVTRENLPKDLVGDWMTEDGHARVSIAPSADPNDNDAMRRFAQAVLAVEPDVTEGPVTILEASRTVLGAFIEAGVLALLSIALLLWLVLRRLSDMLLTLIPLTTAGVVTLEICAVFGMPLNFANIIAFPLLLGVGGGVQNLLHHGLARRGDPSLADESDPRRHLQRHDDRGGVRQPDVLVPPWHRQHGAVAGAFAGDDLVRRGSVSADFDGQAARERGRVALERTFGRHHADPFRRAGADGLDRRRLRGLIRQQGGAGCVSAGRAQALRQDRKIGRTEIPGLSADAFLGIVAEMPASVDESSRLIQPISGTKNLAAVFRFRTRKARGAARPPFVKTLGECDEFSRIRLACAGPDCDAGAGRWAGQIHPGAEGRLPARRPQILQGRASAEGRRRNDRADDVSGLPEQTS